MKKLAFITILLAAVLAFAGKTYADSRIRTDIKDNVKKYNELLIKSVKDLNVNGSENKELRGEITCFIDKYNSIKTTKKEKDLLCGLMSTTLDYLELLNAKKENSTVIINNKLSKFQASSNQLNNYFKK